MPTYPLPEQIDRRQNSGPPGAVDGRVEVLNYCHDKVDKRKSEEYATN